jgi:toxin ParE1/3/4
MEVHLTPEQQHQLAELASQRGRDADALAQEAISRYLAEEAGFVEAVKLGEEALQRGEYLTHEQMGERIGRLLRRWRGWKVRWSTLAADDLERKFERIARDNPTAARETVKAIYEGCATLSRFPQSGRPGRMSGRRELVFSPYVAVYQVKKHPVEISRVYHGAQDWP